MLESLILVGFELFLKSMAIAGDLSEVIALLKIA